MAEAVPDDIKQTMLDQAEVDAYMQAMHGKESIVFDSIENHALACNLEFFKGKLQIKKLKLGLYRNTCVHLKTDLRAYTHIADWKILQGRLRYRFTHEKLSH